MKKLHLLSALMICTLLIRCTEDEPAIDITDIKFDGDKVIVTEGLSYDLNDAITIVGDDADQADISFSSADDAIVSVDGHTLTAEAVGTTTVTATESNSGLTATVEVVVEAKEVAVTAVTLDKSEANLKVGDTFQLTATIAPADATETGLTWSVAFPPESKNLEDTPEDIATVSETGLVTAKTAGNVVVTVTTTDGEFTANVDIAITNVAVTSIVLTPDPFSLEVGETQQMVATILPSNATDKTLTWSIDETGSGCRILAAAPSFATVDENGLVTATNFDCTGVKVVATSADGPKGEAVLTFSQTLVESIEIVDSDGFPYPDKELLINDADCTISVSLFTTVEPENATDRSVTWSIDEETASISSDGLLTMGPGTVRVTITADDSSGLTDYLDVTFEGCI